MKYSSIFNGMERAKQRFILISKQSDAKTYEEFGCLCDFTEVCVSKFR